MVIKGNARGSPIALAQHLKRTDTNERMEVKELRGVAAIDLDTALREMDAYGAALRTSRTLYHASLNTRADEHLTEAQRNYAIDQLEAKLGLTGQARIVVEHEKEGRAHWHVVWSRTDLDHMRAIRCDHNYRKHEEVARQLEREFGHAPVQGAHVGREGQEGERKPRPDRTPSHAEMQQAARSGLSPQQAKAEISAIWQRTDSGKAFAAAVTEAGWVLVQGDKRDFALIDRAGEVHSLARRIDGAKASDVRERMADLDRASLPTVAEGKAMQRERTRESATAERAPLPVADRPLGKVAGEIRMAWSLTESGQGFAAALEDRGLILAVVTGQEAQTSQRTAAFAQAIGGYAPRYSAGELVVLDGKGSVYPINERTTGETRAAIDKHLAPIDRDPLLSMTDARAVMHELRQEQIEAKKEQAKAEWHAKRPFTKVEATIHEANAASRVAAEFVAKLDAAGLTLAKVTTGDLLRQSMRNAATATTHTWKHENFQNLPREQGRLVDKSEWEAGELVAVNRYGNVHRLNRHRLDMAALEERVSIVRPLGSMVETSTARRDAYRADLAQRREARDAASAAAIASWEEYANRPGRTVSPPEKTKAAVKKTGRAVSGMLGGLSKLADSLLSIFEAKPVPTPEQQKEDAKAEAVQEQQARAVEAKDSKAEIDRTRLLEEYRARHALDEREAEARQRYLKSRDDDRGGRERER